MLISLQWRATPTLEADGEKQQQNTRIAIMGLPGETGLRIQRHLEERKRDGGREGDEGGGDDTVEETTIILREKNKAHQTEKTQRNTEQSEYVKIK